jgi:membrane protein involved in colicin uptake
MKRIILSIVLVILVSVCLIFSSPVQATESTQSGYGYGYMEGR